MLADGNVNYTFVTWANPMVPRNAPLWVYGKGVTTDPIPQPEGEAQPLSDEALADLLLTDPARLQIEPGVYPEVWQPVDVADATDSEVGNEENPDESTDEQPEEMIDMTTVTTEVVDMSSYFNFGSGWLPKTCPGREVLAEVQGQPLEFDWSLMCDMARGYIAPFMRVIAVFSFLGILFGGIRE